MLICCDPLGGSSEAYPGAALVASVVGVQVRSECMRVRGSQNSVLVKEEHRSFEGAVWNNWARVYVRAGERGGYRKETGV